MLIMHGTGTYHTVSGAFLVPCLVVICELRYEHCKRSHVPSTTTETKNDDPHATTQQPEAQAEEQKRVDPSINCTRVLISTTIPKEPNQDGRKKR